MAFTKKVVAGQTIAAADFAKFFGDHFSEFVKTGFEVTEGTGLIVDISAGTAYVKDASGYMYQIVSGATETTTLADDSTNYVFLHSDNGATYITDSTTATVPDDAILLATVVTASGDVSTVTDNRTLTPVVAYPLDYYTASVGGTVITTSETTIGSVLEITQGIPTSKTGIFGISCSHKTNSTTGDNYSFKVYYSFDGTNYTQIGSTQTQAINSSVTTNFSNNTTATASTSNTKLYLKFTGQTSSSTTTLTVSTIKVAYCFS